ncbi:hypothetical protein ACFL20_12640 [Spirochaetota bacterium]
MKRFKIIILLLAVAFMFGACKKDKCYWENKPDATTGASSMYFLKKFMVKGKELTALLRNPWGWAPTTVFALTTVRCDGTPNIAIIIPMSIDDKTLLFINVTSTTKKNILATKYARAMLRVVNPKAKSKMNPNGVSGTRMLIKLVEDEKNRKEHYEKYKKLRKKVQPLKDCMFMEILEIYPLG